MSCHYSKKLLLDSSKNIISVIFVTKSIFLVDTNAGYTVVDGDDLTIAGEVTQFSGLAEVEPTSIVVNSSGNAIPDPEIVTTFDESTESKLIKLQNIELVDAGQWDDSGSGSFNVEITDGTNIFEIRIDSDTDILGEPAPSGVFSITGIGGQYDPSAPHDDGYQLFPRSKDDIVEGVVSTSELYTGSISMSPNPATELITVTADDPINRIAIYNINGQLVMTANNTNSLAVSTLSNGAYILRAELDAGVWNEQLMIAR